VDKIDPIRVRELVGHINQSQGRLRQLGQTAEEVFLADYEKTESAKYLLVVAIAAALDLCNHIVARRGGRVPQDYADCFAALAELDILEPTLAKRLQKMARIHNLLVHLYGQVDNRQVYQVIQNDLSDLDNFRHAVLSLLN
jgi:uncharacterized protein YutE (UPF0331/DUF86 family)